MYLFLYIQQVTGVVGRAETLSSVFFLLAFIFYVKSTLEKKSKLTGKYTIASLNAIKYNRFHISNLQREKNKKYLRHLTLPIFTCSISQCSLLPLCHLFSNPLYLFTSPISLTFHVILSAALSRSLVLSDVLGYVFCIFVFNIPLFSTIPLCSSNRTPDEPKLGGNRVNESVQKYGFCSHAFLIRFGRKSLFTTYF